jgi:hypothetical protein
MTAAASERRIAVPAGAALEGSLAIAGAALVQARIREATQAANSMFGFNDRRRFSRVPGSGALFAQRPVRL